MTKEQTISLLNELEKSLKQLHKTITSYNGPQIKQQSVKDTVQKVARKWFEEAERLLAFYNVSDEIRAKYHQLFNDLLHMGIKDTRKGRYEKVLTELRSNFRSELIVPTYKYTGDISNFAQLDAILDSLTEEEKALMKEALDCARSGYLRASVILGWAAAVYRLHKTVEKMGFDTFNKKSEEMSKIQEGRYKRFNKTFHVHNIAELQATVFDNDLLWVLEYCGLIDYNQHERLTTCFVMRNTCAHPSSTKIMPENATSFYSDIKTIIFDNAKFKL